MQRSVLIIMVSLLTACGSSSGTRSDAGPPPGDGQVITDGNVLTDGQVITDGQVHTDGGGPDAAVLTAEYCLPTCTTAVDCNQGSAPYDADNYLCTSGVCIYQGCNSDTECQTLGNYLCRTTAGNTQPYCAMACATPADCNLGSAPYDTDNYLCTNSVCVYQGCNSDSECQALGNYLCRTTGGVGATYCQPACATPADCNLGSAPYDADNYLCTNGVCAYQGCNSDTECQALGNYECAPGTLLPLP